MAADTDFRSHVLATFTRGRDARAAAEAARGRFPEGNARMGDKDDALDALALGQESEMDDSLVAIGPGLFTGPFARGALLGAVLGGIVGGLLVLPLVWLVDVEGTSRWVLAAAFVAAGALGVSSATFVLGAGRQAVKEGETTPEDPTAIVRVDADADGADEVVEFFVSRSARSARFVAAPVERPSSSMTEDPRPLPDDRDVSHGAGPELDAGFRSDVE